MTPDEALVARLMMRMRLKPNGEMMLDFVDVYMDDVRTPPTVGWTVVRSIAEVKRLLEEGKVYRLSLDHDMGACEQCVKDRKDVGDFLTPETTFVSWCPHAEDGTKLVHWMIETGFWPVEKPEVHSMNPCGAARMRGLIDRYWGERNDQDSGRNA